MVSRGTDDGPRVLPMLFRADMRKANAAAEKDTTRRIVSAANSLVHPGTFAGLDLETGRARLLDNPELRARCTFESGRVRVVTITPQVRPGDIFWEKTGRFGSRKQSQRTLEITGVGLARVQDMTDADAVREGVAHVQLPTRFPLHARTPRGIFEWLWGSINGKGSWAANPWVWIYRYRIYQENIDAMLACWEARS